LSTTDSPGGLGRGSGQGPFVTREVCQTTHHEQHEANVRTWEEVRALRRLVIGLMVGGQLFSGGLNLAGFAYWLQQHAAQPHPATVQMVAEIRAEARQDLRDLRQEVRDLAASAARHTDPGRPRTPDKEGAQE
jgi:hypothetical protein